MEVEVVSAAEISFRYRGLEFARASMGEVAGSFRNGARLVVRTGDGGNRGRHHNRTLFRDFVRQMAELRDGSERHHPIYRMQPERWLEARVKRDLGVLDERLDPSCVYAQVPAFAATDRAMIDLLGVTREGRLAVIELKAEEDMHLPLQGLDYWARVRWHQQRGRVPALWVFSGSRTFARSSAAVAGRAFPARAPNDRFAVATLFTGDRVEAAGPGRALAQRHTGDLPQERGRQD